MIEDNPFYTVDFVENDDNQTNSNTENQNENLNTEETENNTVTDSSAITSDSENITSELQRENVQEPEKENSLSATEETKSTGVSTYTEVPSINKESIDCNTHLLSVMDKFNMLLVFAFIIWTLISFKKKKFTKIIESSTTFFAKYTGIINLVLLSLTFVIFFYPKFLGTGISGKLDLFTMFEFSLAITINAMVLTFLSINFLRNKKILFKKPRTFSGILFLEKSLITFSLSGLLFFFFTESQIALSLLYFFILLSSLFFFMQKNEEEFLLIKELCIFALFAQTTIIGILSGFYPVILFSALIIGSTYQNTKQIYKNLVTPKEK